MSLQRVIVTNKADPMGRGRVMLKLASRNPAWAQIVGTIGVDGLTETSP